MKTLTLMELVTVAIIRFLPVEHVPDGFGLKGRGQREPSLEHVAYTGSIHNESFQHTCQFIPCSRPQGISTGRPARVGCEHAPHIGGVASTIGGHSLMLIGGGGAWFPSNQLRDGSLGGVSGTRLSLYRS